MKKKFNVITGMLLALVMVMTLAPGAAAREQTTVNPDSDQCSITVNAKYGGKKVINLGVAIYRVGEAAIQDSNLVFPVTEVMKPAEGEEAIEFDGATVEQTQKNIQNIRKKIRSLTPEQRESIRAGAMHTNDEGQAIFENIKPGVYLVEHPTRGNYNFDSFLVYVPFMNEENTAWDMDAVVSLKISHEGGGGPDDPEPPVDPEDPGDIEIIDPEVPLDPFDPVPPIVPEVPEVPGEPDEDLGDPDVPQAELLPQTGLLQWPIPVMSMAGLLLIVGGILLQQKAKNRN